MKTITIHSPAPYDGERYTMLPFGLYCNKALREAQKGDVIEFQTPWRRKRLELVRKCVLNVNTPVFGFLFSSVMTRFPTVKDMMKQWESECIVEGYGRNGFNRNEVMLIEVKEIEDGETELE